MWHFCLDCFDVCSVRFLSWSFSFAPSIADFFWDFVTVTFVLLLFFFMFHIIWSPFIWLVWFSAVTSSVLHWFTCVHRPYTSLDFCSCYIGYLLAVGCANIFVLRWQVCIICQPCLPFRIPGVHNFIYIVLAFLQCFHCLSFYALWHGTEVRAVLAPKMHLFFGQLQ